VLTQFPAASDPALTAEIRIPGDLPADAELSGFAILGTPYIRSGHNLHLAWSHSNNYAFTSDTYLHSTPFLSQNADSVTQKKS
jgi:acyl-homoserine lactone acylase PvdQ